MAGDYYHAISPALAQSFMAEVFAAIERACHYPQAWSALENSTIRRSMVNRFPYGILYTQTPEKILVLAVMNLHREPNYWKDRH